MSQVVEVEVEGAQSPAAPVQVAVLEQGQEVVVQMVTEEVFDR